MLTSILELLQAVLSNYTPGHPSLRLKLKEFISNNEIAIINLLRPNERINFIALKQTKALTGILSWIGGDSPNLKVVSHHGAQNTIPYALLSVFKLLSTHKWKQRLVPINDLETIKARTLSPFVMAGSKHSVYMEECTQLCLEICRNILVFNLNVKVPYFGKPLLTFR